MYDIVKCNEPCELSCLEKCYCECAFARGALFVATNRSSSHSTMSHTYVYISIFNCFHFCPVIFHYLFFFISPVYVCIFILFVYFCVGLLVIPQYHLFIYFFYYFLSSRSLQLLLACICNWLPKTNKITEKIRSLFFFFIFTLCINNNNIINICEFHRLLCVCFYFSLFFFV